MPHSVELPAEVVPVFPDRCVVCNRDAPGDATELSALFNGMKPLAEPLAKVHHAKVPTCAGCKAKLVGSRWLGKLVTAVAIAIGCVLIFGLAQLGWIEGWKAYVGIILALLVPLSLASLIYTAYFDFQPWDHRLVFEFRSRDYAQAFLDENEQAGARMR